MHPRPRPRFVYKASARPPRRYFQPRWFWRTRDFRNSSNNPFPKPGIIRDRLLYAGLWSHIAIHLFPRIPRILIDRRQDRDHAAMAAWLHVEPTRRRMLVVDRSELPCIARFDCLVHRFGSAGFCSTPSGEMVARRGRRPESCRRLSNAEVLRRWSIQLVPVDDVHAVEKELLARGFTFSMQT